jgi:alpha-glucosidase (family GH31 glycosyl hydrolase)
LHHGLVEAGVDGIWVDMNEPSAFLRGTLPGDVRHAAGAHWELHNAYGHLMAQATFEGLERLRPGRRPFVLSHLLMPYTYTAFWRHGETGLPVLRPFALAWQDDEMRPGLRGPVPLGRLAAGRPVLRKGARRRHLYLPAGDWYDLWSAGRLAGPRSVVVDAPLGRTPVFVRGGSVLPLADGRLLAYPGGGVSWLYEDDGESVVAERRGEAASRFGLEPERARGLADRR